MDINIRSQDRSEAAKQSGPSSAGGVQIDPTALRQRRMNPSRLGAEPRPSGS
jgi:hypothetical protein